jgi:hypothetical protein
MTKRRNTRRQPVSDLLLTMRERAESMSQGHRQVAAAMLADPDFAVRANVDAMARRANVSPPTIIRFCRARRQHARRSAQSLAGRSERPR